MSRDYYKGAYRAMLGGVPCRLARKPGKTSLALMQSGYKRAGYDSKHDVRRYAEAMGITETEARERIAAQMEVGSDGARWYPLKVRAAETEGYYAGGVRITVGGVPCRVNPTYAAIRSRPWYARWPS